MTDMIAMFLVSEIIAIYLVLKLIYPKDKIIAGILLAAISVLMISNLGATTTVEIVTTDLNAGMMDSWVQIDTNSASSNQNVMTIGYGIIVMMISIYIIVRDVIDKFYPSKTTKKGR